MSTIKKPFQPLHSFLLENKNKRVSTILAELEEMMASKTRETTSLYDAEHNLIAIFCYYHKVWEIVKDVTDRGNDIDYGSKANSKTGLNTMCKKGVSRWTKQQSVLKAIPSDLMDELLEDKIKPDEIRDEQTSREIEARLIIQEENQLVFNTVDELSEYLGYELYARESK